MTEQDPRLVTAQELATIIGRDEETIWRWARQRKVAHYKLPDGGVRFPLAEILDDLRVEAATGAASPPQEGAA